MIQHYFQNFLDLKQFLHWKFYKCKLISNLIHLADIKMNSKTFICNGFGKNFDNDL